jgi:RNA-splicing ligase RtcB
MQLLQSEIDAAEFKRDSWDLLGKAIARNKGSLGDLGGGNHFLDAIVEQGTNRVFFLIHTGSRIESGLVDEYVNQPDRFDKEFARVVTWARHNRDALATNVRAHFGKCELVSDLPHNTYEQLGNGVVVIRKGANKVTAGERCILPSSMAGDVVELEATALVSDTFDSLSHGTGRAISRSEAKDTQIDFAALRAATYIPDFIRDDSLRTDGPLCYRRLDECLELLTPVAREVRRFKVVAYLGHLP